MFSESLLRQNVTVDEVWDTLGHRSKLLFRESIGEEAYFRAELTLVLEGHSGFVKASPEIERTR